LSRDVTLAVLLAAVTLIQRFGAPDRTAGVTGGSDRHPTA